MNLADILFPLASSLIVTLMGLIGWVGSKMSTKQDIMLDKLDAVKDEIHKRLNNIEVRLVRVETLIHEEDEWR